MFPPYKPDEIYMIVEDRLRLALSEGFELSNCVDEEALRLLSALAAQKDGDARYAIDLLREAVKLWIVNGGKLSL